jgi:hypothetical protein
LTILYENKEELCGAYGSVPKIIDKYVENMFSDIYWMQKQGKKMMEMTEIPHHDYPEKLMPLIRHTYDEVSKSFSS